MHNIYKVSTSAMEFSDEEKKWLLSISAEIPEDENLTVKEEELRELAKPTTETEGQLFQIMASICFGLTEPLISDLDMTIHERSMWLSVAKQCPETESSSNDTLSSCPKKESTSKTKPFSEGSKKGKTNF